MDKFWLKSYPKEVPAEVQVDQYQSLVALLEDSFRRFASRKAYACMGKTITYREVDQLSQRVAGWLQSKGLAKGARVAIMMPNVLHYPVIMAAVLRAGYTVVNVNPLYTPRELEHQLNDSGAEAIFILENFASTLQQVISTGLRHVVVASMGDLHGFLKGSLINFVVRSVKKWCRHSLYPVSSDSMPCCLRHNRPVLSLSASVRQTSRFCSTRGNHRCI
jgi:long-chain acyl-CoA synthetase